MFKYLLRGLFGGSNRRYFTVHQQGYPGQMKKLKNLESEEISTKNGLFAHFRKLGIVTDDVPFAITNNGGVLHITCSVGETFHIYNLEKIDLVFVGPKFDDKISSIAAQKNLTFIGSGRNISVLERATEIKRISLPEGPISKIAIFNDYLVASSDRSIYIIDAQTFAVIHSETWSNKQICSFIHPETYLNKILVAFTDGSMILFNIKTRKMIYEFTGLTGQKMTSITASPDPDIVALGFFNGNVVFFDLKMDKVLFNLKIEGAVTSMAFRTDEMAHVIVGSSRGEIFVFELEERKLVSILAGHSLSVSALWFVPNQPLFLSSSADNCLKEWLYESSEYRLLKQRSGHYKTPSKISFFGGESKYILSAGEDRSLRFFSVTKDSQNFEFSQGSTQKTAAKLKISAEELRLPEIISFDAFDKKPLKWDNMITAHEKSASAYTWRVDRKCIGEHILTSTDNSKLNNVSISSCGNFGILSSNSGLVDVYNMQSGKHRRTFKAFEGAGAIMAATDATNTKLVCVSAKGEIKIFAFANGKLLESFEVGQEVVKCALHRDTDLLALACTDFSIVVFDFAAVRIVRNFVGHKQQVTDMTWSSSSKWIISASRDRTICTWDIMSGKRVNLQSTKNVPLTLAFADNEEFLAVCYEHDISIELLSNRALYSGDVLQADDSFKVFEQNQSDDWKSNGILYSDCPSSKWKNIYFLEKIRANTKPVLMNKEKKASLPFFLTQSLLANKSAENTEELKEETNVASAEFSEALREFLKSENFNGFYQYLEAMSVNKLDFEIRCITPTDRLIFVQFILKTLMELVKSGKSFELVQSVLALTLRHHETFISENINEFVDLLRELSAQIKNTWGPLENLLQTSICLLAFTKEL